MEVGVDETLDGDLQGRVLEPRGACADRREVVVGGVEEVGLVTGERAYAFEGARGKRGLQRVIRELELQAASHLRDLLGRGGGVQLGKLETLDGVDLHRHRSLRHTRAAPAQPPLADQQAVFLGDRAVDF